LFPGRYACVALGSFLLGVAAVVTLPLGPAADGWWRSLCGVACSLIGMGVMIAAPLRVAFPLGWRRHPARRRLALATTLALAAATIILYAGESAALLGAPPSQAYRTDVVAFTDVNARLALAGRDPYTADSAFRTALRRDHARGLPRPERALYPDILANPGAWLPSLWLPMDASLFPYGMGIVALSTGRLLRYGPPPLYGALEALALALGVWAAARWHGGAATCARTRHCSRSCRCSSPLARSLPTSPSRRGWPCMA